MYNANQHEQEILELWERTDAFKKSVNQRPENRPYVFYDGPPFATGLPHYGHILASLVKDTVPRYWTMRGYRVERVWGWDCHGLPIENIIEKEMGTKTKKEIEAMGVAEFNERCRSKVLGYVEDWKKTVRRLGRWVDMENAYVTMSRDYMESVWWVFKQLWDKGLIYEDYRSMHICPRCETTLSQQEVSEGYKDVKDISVYVKFKVKENEVAKKLNLPANTSILAWTTTPWTLPGNVALAVGEEVAYTVVKTLDPEKQKTGVTEYINLLISTNILDGLESNSRPDTDALKLAFGIVYGSSKKEREPAVKGYEKYRGFINLKGSDLAGLEYEPLFPYYKETANAFRVVGDSIDGQGFVTTDTGTGIVHIAPAFGEDDFKVGKREQIPLVQHVGMDGRMKSEVIGFENEDLSIRAKGKPEEVREIDLKIRDYLKEKGLLFASDKFPHSYPHCWRCDTPLLNYATSSWFVKVTAIKDEAIQQATKINWSPEHIKEGRFGQWLGGARDWSISRQRFWASVMPVWHCADCKQYRVFGSASELEEASGQKIADLHKHVVDLIVLKCECSGEMKRVPDVLDTWFDSGSMPYAQMHYPFENKEKFEASFPAKFIAEGQDQTRAWFYYLHVLATGLRGTPAFQNVIVNGIILAEDGKKMSKKLQNYPDPNVLLEKYGADALRYYMVTSPVVRAQDLNFSEAGVREAYGKVVNTLWNVVEFYKLFASENAIAAASSKNVLDRWVLAKLQQLIETVQREMEVYNLSEASRPVAEFIDELSTWYVRRSRDRFKGEDATDKAAALATLREVLVTLSKVMAPFTPFIAEKVYQEMGGTLESVHLELWPEAQAVDTGALDQMQFARTIVEIGLALRAEAGVKVRQVLSELRVEGAELGLELRGIVADEMNVKEITFGEINPEFVSKTDGGLTVALDLKITEALQKEGLAREFIRTVNQMRKEAGLSINDTINISYATDDALLSASLQEYASVIMKAVLAKSLTVGSASATLVKVDGRSISITL